MLTEQRESLFNLRLKLRTGHLENTASLGAARREIARLTTVLHEAQLGIVHPVKGGAHAAHPEAHKARSRKGPSKKRNASKKRDASNKKTASKKPKTKKTSRK